MAYAIVTQNEGNVVDYIKYSDEVTMLFIDYDECANSESYVLNSIKELYEAKENIPPEIYEEIFSSLMVYI